MSSVHPLREFICERLTAAAAEIFSQFEQTILRYEEEIDRQRRLLDLCWKPELKLHRVVLQQKPVHKTRTLKDQQFCNQERNSSLNQEEPEPLRFEDQEDPEPPQIKVEDQELCTNQEEDQLHLKQETDPVMVSVLNEESESEPDREQLISQSSAGPEDQDQDSGSNDNHTECRGGNQAVPSATLVRLFYCQICGESFLEKLLHFRHVKVHKVWNQNSDRPMYFCPTCGKKFSAYSLLITHMRIHTGEKPFICKTCGKMFNQVPHLKKHITTHRVKKPFNCKTCGRAFILLSSFKRHMKTHTDKQILSCKHCEKDFSSHWQCKQHVMIHTGERPFSCKTCGKRFNRNSHLNRHMKVHRD